MTSNGKNGHLGDDQDAIPGFEEVEIVHTTDEEGNVHIFEKIDELEIDGQDYALLIYKGTETEEANGEHGDVTIKQSHHHHHEEGETCSHHHHKDDEDDDEDESDDEVVVMRISYEDGLQVYENIDDEEEFEKVVQAIENLELEGDGEEIDIVALGQLLNELEEDSETDGESGEPSEFEKHKQKKEQRKKDDE